MTIQGGGIGGLTLAALLERRLPDAHVTVVEQAPAWAPLGAGITLTGNALRQLDQAGLGDELLDRGLPMQSSKLADARGRVLLEARPGQISGGRDRWTQIVLSIHRAELHEALLGALGRTELRLGATLELDVSDGDVARLRIAGSSEALESDLVVGADGVGSTLRQQVGSSSFRYAGYTCWRGVVDLPGDPVATTPSSWEIWGGARRFGVIPLRGERVYFYACINARESDERYTGLDGAGFAELFDGIGGPVPTILDAVRQGATIHHDDLGEIHSERWHRGPLVLLGDAAHAMTPNLGQGAAMAIEDAAVLSEELAQKDATPTLAAERFEARRRPRVERLQSQAFRLGRVAQWERSPASWLRDRLVSLTPDRVGARQMQTLVDATI